MKLQTKPTPPDTAPFHFINPPPPPFPLTKFSEQGNKNMEFLKVVGLNPDFWRGISKKANICEGCKIYG